MPRVLITGAAGFIGMHTSIRFLREGWDVIGLDNMNDYYSPRLKEDRILQIEKTSNETRREFIFYRADLNSKIWEEFTTFRIKSVIHLAAQAGVRYSIENPMAYIESNILGFQRVIDFVHKNKIQRFLYASSSSVYGKKSNQPFSEDENCTFPESYYAATKKANELLAFAYGKTHGLRSVGMRFFTVYGPWGRPDMAPMIFANAAKLNETIKVFNYGRQQRDFTYIDDVVNGIFLLNQVFDKNSLSEVYNIGNGAPTELLSFIEQIEELFKVEIDKKYLPAQKGDVDSTFADIQKIAEITGYEPKTNLSKGLEQFVRWFKDYY